VARAAAHGVTGRRLPHAALARYAAAEAEADAELAAEELRFIAADMALKRLRAARAAREAMTAGMTLADFEQLRVENSALHEKVEARAEEFGKLRKKDAAAAAVLSHVREKLWAVGAERAALLADVARLDADVAAQRAALTAAKHARDATARENAANAGAAGFAFNDRLAVDFAATQREVGALRAQLEALQARGGV